MDSFINLKFPDHQSLTGAGAAGGGGLEQFISEVDLCLTETSASLDLALDKHSEVAQKGVEQLGGYSYHEL